MLAAPRPGSAALTWSWETVQTYVHCANKTGAWNSDALQAMSASAFVVFEKNTGEFSMDQAPGYPPAMDGCEGKIEAACKQLKTVSPTTDCYMYTESDWARQYYSLGHRFTQHPDWCLRAADGTRVTKSGEDRNPLDNSTHPFTNFAYDFSVADAREAWVARVTDAVATGVVDGAFIDGNRGGWGSTVLNGCTPEKKRAWSVGLNTSHAMLRQRLGEDKVLISNYPTPEALEWCTGGMVERFTPDQHQQDLQALAKAGKLADIHAQYFKDMATSPHLAAFLVGMGKWSYFGAGSGWDGDGADACATWLKVWPEYSKPLGEPVGPATVVQGNGKTKSIWTRKFKSGTHVFLNTTDHPKVDTFCIWWSDGTASGNHCKPSTLAFVRSLDEPTKPSTLKTDDAHALALALAGPNSPRAPLTFLPITPLGARCLSGSPYAFYYVPALNATNNTRWTVYLQGGGYCLDEASCWSRAHQALGNSSDFPRTSECICMNGAVGYDGSCHCLYLPYCDGASFAGFRAKPWPVNASSPAGDKVYFRGLANLDDTLDYAFEHLGLGAATEVVLTGASAGGVATFLHMDRVAERMGPAVRTVAAPVVGLFLDYTPLNASGPSYSRYHDLGLCFQASLPDSNETLRMLNRHRELTLPRPTAAPTVTSSACV